ncbi:MurR/RpiR family transcriptional regulator [Vallitalea pronyensis]|uniref:MurR/RpiR family transcriptional regulator n=1 Tax=Vallitalea pronyensis TaxID=1348613 RepID=A0A8J8MKL5_9FIRM|nr:MurR/RpiR family transcriptional regulator [Vallitalea pronyensis]QUI22958.1 MurR/RpiR family transcriptional regulator [Vallitalea pronyensis]
MDIWKLMDIYDSELTKADKKIKAYIIKNEQEVIYSSLTQMAKEVKVGETSILRFCRKLGYSGFQDFKIELAKQSHQEIEEVLTVDNYVDRIAQNMMTSIDNTRMIIDQKALDQAVQRLRQARHILFYGLGASGITASEASGRFTRIGYFTQAISDNHYQLIHSAIIKQQDVIVAISLSGSTKEIIDAVKVAKENGACIIAITNQKKSLLATLSDIVLITAGKEKPLEGGSLIAKIAQLYIIDLLCTGLSLEDYQHTLEIKEKTSQAIFNN